ncbi:MAG: acyl--CoA ligase [Deltaproteobacteria bacterium]|nr:MAG: acyl--CoA ligase [Deltaproteobacteria bacterium]
MYVNMGRVFQQTALQFASGPAVINVERDRHFTYAQMHELSNRLSNALKHRFGLRQGDFYATILDNDNVALFHPWMLKSPVGAVWIDANESVGEQINQIDYIQPKLVFLETRLLPLLYEHLQTCKISMAVMDRPQKPWPGVYYFWDLVEQAAPTEVEEEITADDASEHISVLRFTGGTTGRAKCAMYTLFNLWIWGCNPAHFYETLPFEHPRALFFSPLHHAASGSVVIPAHIKGGTIITLNRADPESVGRNIARQQADMIYAVPTVLYRMLEMNLPRKYDLSSLKTIRYGGAPISPSKLEILLDLFGQIFVQGYGSTECWPSVTILARKDHGTDTQEQLQKLLSVGRPLPGEEVIICDEDGNILAAGQRGEIWIRGPNTIEGYYKAPDLTKDNFSAAGFWKSGDIGYMDDEGYVYLVDRKQDMIITGGYNVYAIEVENCLNSHPGVQNSAVVGIPHDIWGEAVCAMVTLAQGCEVSPPELIDHCKQHLARYKAPKKIEITAQLPTSPAGKVLRREVRRQLRFKGGDKPQD